MNTENELSSQESYIKMDSSLMTAEERTNKVKEIIASTPPEKLTPFYLEKLANYILDAKDEKKSRSTLSDNRKHYQSLKETSFEGLVGKLENGEDGIYHMIANDKNIIAQNREPLTQEEIDTIPGLKDLTEAIAQVEKQLASATGKRRYLLKKQIIEMQKDKYVLKAAYKKPIYSMNLIKSLSRLDLAEKIFVKGTPCDPRLESTGILSFFNPSHISLLLHNYSRLKMDNYEKMDSDIKWMMEDLDDLIERTLAEKHPLLRRIVILKIDGISNAAIQSIIQEEFQVMHSVEYISALWCKKIPLLLAAQAELDYLEWYYTYKERGNYRKCSRCGQIKLSIPQYFSRNKNGKDGLYSICKECRAKKKEETKWKNSQKMS